MATGGNGNGTSPPEPGGPGPVRRWVPGPGWQRRATPIDRRARRRRRQRLVLAALGIACLVGAWALAFSESVPSVEPTIADARFVGDANGICRPVQERLADRTEVRRGDATDDDRADAIDGLVAELDAMVTDLSALRPAPGDAPEVTAWLGAWREVLASGRATAAALREGDDDAAERAADAGQGPARDVNAFARANDIGWCATRFG